MTPEQKAREEELSAKEKAHTLTPEESKELKDLREV